MFSKSISTLIKPLHLFVLLLFFLFNITIVYAQTIHVTSPNGGENWNNEKEYNIEWTDNIVENVKIELWKANEMVQIIATSTTSDGFYRWDDAINLEEDSDYKVRIVSLNNELIEDYSDNYFIISNDTKEGGLTISLPHEYEHEIIPEGDVDWYNFELVEGVTYRFYNTSTINLDTEIKLYRGQWEEYFYVFLLELVAEDDNSDGNQQPFFDYTPTFTYSYWLKVDMSDDVNESDEITGDYTLHIYDLSNQLVTVTRPNVREYWKKGSTYEITWNDAIDENVRIDLWKGGTYDQGGTQIVITTTTESDGSYNWTIPADIEIGMEYKIRVKSVVDPSNKLLFDYSDNYFTIVTDHSQSSLNNAVEITIPHEQGYQISSKEDVDWYNFQLVFDKTYRFYNTSTINLDTELYLHRGFVEDGSITLTEIVALDDKSGGNQQPFFDYLVDYNQYEGLNFWLQLALDYNETNETAGDYTLHIFELSDKLNLKMFLEGAYNETTDMMNIQLGANIPKSSPYSDVDAQTVDEIPEGVVDWVLVELRDRDDNLRVVSARSAFLLNTGMIVEVDGFSDVQFNVPKDSYYIVVKHRNHLPVMSAGLVEF